MYTCRKQEQKAVKLLKKPENYPSLVQRQECDRQLLLYCFPSFKVFSSWALFETEGQYWLRRITWNFTLQFPDRNAEPYIFGCEVCFDRNIAKELLLSLSSISLNPFVQPLLFGIDGTVYGIEAEHLFSCSVQWWCSLPENWSSLDTWYGKAIALFEQTLPDRTLSEIFLN